MREELVALGVPADVVEDLVRLLERPPAGVLDAEDRPGADTDRLALHAVLLGATDLRRYGAAVHALAQRLDATYARLSRYDRGRLQHVRGLVAWRLDGASFRATRALNASIRELSTGGEREKRYLARVHDTFGQMLHMQGMLADALGEYRTSLALRDAERDRFGLAITHGNLGRLQMDVGNYREAANHLAIDLAIVSELDGSPRLRAQLTSHLAECHLSLGAVAEASELFTSSYALAAGDPVSSIFSSLGLGRVALHRADAPSALRIAGELLEQIAALDVSKHTRSSLLAAAHKLAGDARLAAHEHDAAIASYRSSVEELGNTASPIEYAQVFRGLSKALAAKQEHSESASHLRRALRHLDGTAAEDLRREVENDLQKLSSDSWLLHAAGRFVGQQHIEFLLTEGGKAGFRGDNRRIVAMFSDLRGFTTISESLQPREVIGFLNDYLSHMTRSIEGHGGMVDKFMGDGIMAIFELADDNSNRALACALAMREELERFNRSLAGRVLSVGIGIHGGEVVAGLIGSPQKREYTVIGDVVNTAARLEGMTKQLGATTLVTSAVLSPADHERFLLRPLGKFAPKGRSRGLEVFDLMGERDSSTPSEIHDEIAASRAALDLYAARELDRAAGAFEALAHTTRETPRAAGYTLLASRARVVAASPPDGAWSGEIALTEK